MQLMEGHDCFVPKHHILFHAMLETPEKGNPWKYSAWLDEALNKVLRSCCRNASQLTFDEVVLLKTTEVLKSEPTYLRSRKRASE